MNSVGMIEGEECSRNGCVGVLYQRIQYTHAGIGADECTCHLGYPPCWYCEHLIGCCPECGWNEIDSLGTREVLIEKNNGKN